MKLCTLSALISAFALQTLASAEDRRSDTSRLVVMTMNTLFMWDGIAPEEGGVDFPWKGSETEAREHMEEIAEVIIQNNPDILNLVEIENENALTILNNEFLAGRGYEVYFVQGTDTATGQDLGVLTRIDPIGDSIERDNGMGTSGGLQKSVSKNYFARFEINGHQIALVGLHFLARPNDATRKFPRQAQADLMGSRAEQLAAEGFMPIVLGDFNDFDDDVPDHIDSHPITNVLWRVKRMESGNFDDDLINVAGHVPPADRFTAFFDQDEDNMVDQPQELTSIDHILIAPGLDEFVESVNIPHLLNPVEVTDHYPIVLTLKFDGTTAPSGPRPRMVRLLPNPPGNENTNEEVTIRNIGNAPVDLAGFKLRDLVGKTWTLNGTLAPNESRVVKRNGQPMAMNNGGDTIELVDPDGDVVQSVTYDAVEEGEEILPVL